MDEAAETPRARVAPAGDALDYRPLPPARRRERLSPSVALPPVEGATAPRPRRGPRSLVPPLLAGTAGLLLLLLLVLSGVRVQSGARALATPAIPNMVLPYTPDEVSQARTRAEGSRDPEAWVALGNVFFDNMQTMRERAPLSPQYLGSLPQWLEAAEAYSQALELGAPPSARADLAIARFHYGVATNDRGSVEQALVEVERASREGPDDPRVLLNYGLLLAGLDPPRRADARAAWERLVAVAPQSPEAQSAKTLLESDGK